MSRAQAIAPDWLARLNAAGLTSLPALLHRTPSPDWIAGGWSELTKPGLKGRQRWRWDLPEAHGATRACFLKIYRAPPLRQQLDRMQRQSGRHSHAWWEYQVSAFLERRQIAAPRAIAFAEEMTGAIERGSAVLFEAVPGDAFDRTWRAWSAAGAAVTRGAQRHDLAVRLGRFVAAFHSTGLCHRDLYLCHVFVAAASASSAPTFSIIDLARACRPRLRRMRWLIKDLAQLDASAQQLGLARSDRLRTLLAYLGLQPGSRRTRWYVRRIIRKSGRILQREARKHRA